jgi:hypothetical protein
MTAKVQVDRNEFDRRQYPCPSHVEIVKSLEQGDVRMQNIEDKIDLIIAQQLRYMEVHTETVKDVARIKSIIENGLKKDVSETAIAVRELTSKINILEDFSWFRNWMNSLRDNLFKNILKIGFACAILYFVVWFVGTFGKEAVLKMMH